jgi:TRAP transporter TAXI family solute receptor
MRFSFIALLSLFIPAISAPAWSAEFGTREEALAMVKRAQAKFKKDGLEATYQAINSGLKEFNDRDLYVFSFEFSGLEHANGQVHAVVGKNILDLKDQDGKFVVQDMIAIVKSAGHGWIDYRWLNPVTKTIEDKSAYVERVGTYDIVVGVGIYRNEQLNTNTVGLISGSPNSDDTYLQMAYDLAEVLNDGDNLRILPIAGIGGPRNIRDVRYVKGIDIGLTQTSILNSFRRSNERMGQTENKIVYIAKLFNEEVHLVARSDVTSISQLKGRKVNLDAKGSGTSYSMRDIFKALDIDVEEVSMSQTEAIERLKSGEIAATALIAGKPVRSMSRLDPADGLHFVPIPFGQPLIADYLPTALTHDDYPAIIPAGQSVETIAAGAVLITYNWPKSAADRYQRLERFVEAFFAKIDQFRLPPRHPKWREVNIAATLPGWTRFEAAQKWIDSRRVADSTQTAASSGGSTRVDPALYQEFLQWKQQRQGQAAGAPAVAGDGRGR